MELNGALWEKSGALMALMAPAVPPSSLPQLAQGSDPRDEQGHLFCKLLPLSLLVFSSQNSNMIILKLGLSPTKDILETIGILEIIKHFN